MKRVLITGSRTWDDSVTIMTALVQYQVSSGLPATELTLVSGHCPKGADTLAEIAAETCGWNIERHPAQWDMHSEDCPEWHIQDPTYCRRAGFVRNKRMVDLGADICFAFIKDGSKGATATAALADEAGIPVRRYIR